MSFAFGFTGHRNRSVDERWLSWLHKRFPHFTTWIHGGARGFDSQVEAFAKRNGIKTEVILPDYENFPANTAPLTRNRWIVDKSDIMVACWDRRLHGGTFYTIRFANEVGVPVLVLPCGNYKSSNFGFSKKSIADRKKKESTVYEIGADSLKPIQTELPLEE